MTERRQTGGRLDAGPRRLWLGAMAGVVAVIAAGGIAHMLDQPKTGLAQVAPLDPGCDLNAGPCSVSFPDGARVELSIGPRPIDVLTRLALEVRTEGLEASAVEVDLRGVGMNMGFNRPSLERIADGSYRGQGTLGSCISNRMMWEAMVVAHTDRGALGAPFRFETVREP